MDPHKHYSIYSWICRVTWKLSKQDSSPATGCLRMWEPMCSSGQGLLHSSIVKSLARDIAGFSRPVRWYSEPLQLMHISVERANLVPGLFPRTWLATPSLWHIWRRFPLRYVSSTWRHCHLTPGQEKTEVTREDLGSSWKAVFLHGLQSNTHLECAKRSPQDI